MVAASRVGATYAARVSLSTGAGLPMLLRRLRTALSAQVSSEYGPVLAPRGIANDWSLTYHSRTHVLCVSGSQRRP